MIDFSSMSDSEVLRFATVKRRERKPVKNRRKKVRPGRLKGKKLTELRREVYERDGGMCQWEGCGKWLPFDGDVFTRAHMAHRRNKRMWGDNLENARILCHAHHIIHEHCGGKVVPKK